MDHDDTDPETKILCHTNPDPDFGYMYNKCIIVDISVSCVGECISFSFIASADPVQNNNNNNGNL